MTIRDLKTEMRLNGSYDMWGTGMDVWFTIAGQMCYNGEDIPANWEYRPGAGDSRCEDSYFFEMVRDATPEQRLKAGEFLEKYLKLLEKQGMSY